MRRELLRLAWRTLTTWRRTPDPPAEHPGDDEQWTTLPKVRNRHGRNPQAQQDNDDRRWTP